MMAHAAVSPNRCAQGVRQYSLRGLDDPAPSSRPPAPAIGLKSVLRSDPERGVRQIEVVNLVGSGSASIATFETNLARSPECGGARRSSRNVPSFNADNPTCIRRGIIHLLVPGGS